MSYLKTMLSNNQAASFGRAGSFVIASVWLIICVVLTVQTQTAVDIPIQWAYLAGALFGATKLPEVVGAFRNRKDETDAPPNLD